MNIRQQGNGERVWTGNPHTKKENDEQTHTQMFNSIMKKKYKLRYELSNIFTYPICRAF